MTLAEMEKALAYMGLAIAKKEQEIQELTSYRDMYKSLWENEKTMNEMIAAKEKDDENN